MKLRLFRSLSAPWLVFVLAILPWLQPVVAAQSPESVEEKPLPAAVPPAEPASVAEPAESTEKPTTADPAEEATEAGKSPSPTGEEITPPVAPSPPPAVKEKEREGRPRRGDSKWRHSDNSRVSVMQNSTLEAGGETNAVVSIFGSSTSAGRVRDTVLSVFGSSTSSGQVGGAVVSVFGNTRVTGGTVGDSAVAVMGNNYVNGYIRGYVVAVFGNVELGPEAVVDGKIVCVGGVVKRDPKSIVRGDVQNVAFGGHEYLFEGVSAWVTRCLLYGRPLAFGPHLMWAWWIAFTFLALHVFIALVAPASVAKCVQTLEERPGKAILAAVLTMLLTPVVYVLLAFTVFIAVGVALIPLFTLGLFFAGIFGKVVMLSWIGWQLGKLWSSGGKMPAAAAGLIGGVIVLGLYTVPLLGFIVYKLLGVLGLGVVVYTLMLSIKGSRATAAGPSQPPIIPPAPVMTPPMAMTEEASSPGSVLGSAFGVVPPVLPAVVPVPAVISAATLPRAGFWLRLGAALLDVILVSIIFGLLDGMFSWFLKVTGSFPLWFAVYNVALWATKGTTIGGIICGLKVVRLDDRPLDWSIAVVRGLGAFLSLAVAGLGFIWVGFDDEKQSWHDKIAGTTIVRVPKGTPLI